TETFGAKAIGEVLKGQRVQVRKAQVAELREDPESHRPLVGPEGGGLEPLLALRSDDPFQRLAVPGCPRFPKADGLGRPHRAPGKLDQRISPPDLRCGFVRKRFTDLLVVPLGIDPRLEGGPTAALRALFGAAGTGMAASDSFRPATLSVAHGGHSPWAKP